MCNFAPNHFNSPMKKVLSISLSICLLLTSSSLSAQKKDKNVIEAALPYDSLTNFLGENVAQYKGHELWLKPLPKQQQEYGYSNFIMQYKKDDDVLNAEKNVYKCCDGYNSKYKELENKHFWVKEVLKHPKSKKDNEDRSDEFYLQLQDKASGDVVYYKYAIDSEFTFPFVVMGFLEKQKAMIVGKEYVFADNVIAGAKDRVSGQRAITTVGVKWKCVDLIVDNGESELSVIVENAQKQQIAIPLSVISDTELPLKSYPASKIATYRKQFGNYTTFNRILQQKVVKGMTKDMCRMSWGEPIEIIPAASIGAKDETWAYPANNLVFRNGRVIAIN